MSLYFQVTFECNKKKKSVRSKVVSLLKQRPIIAWLLKQKPIIVWLLKQRPIIVWQLMPPPPPPPPKKKKKKKKKNKKKKNKKTLALELCTTLNMEAKLTLLILP